MAATPSPVPMASAPASTGAEEVPLLDLAAVALLESSIEGIYGIDLSGRCTFINRAASEILGYAPGELIGKNMHVAVHHTRADGAPYAEAECPIFQVCRRDSPVSPATTQGGGHAPSGVRLDDEVLWRKDGTSFPATYSASAVLRGGEIVGAVVCFSDIGERKKAQQVARELIGAQAERVAAEADRERITAILDSISDPFLSFDRQWRYLYINRSATELLRRPREELLGKITWDEFPGSKDSVLGRGCQKAMETGQVLDFQEYSPTLDQWYEVHLYPHQDGLSAYLRNITARKRAEEELAQRAAELSRSNAELEQFAYVASHDLQEPLRMVASYAQLLARRYQGKLGQDADEFIGYLVDGARRMQGLINDLLAYSRVGTRGKELLPVSLDRALDRAVLDLTALIEENGATVTRDPLPTVRGDEGQLVQLMQNLVGNAVKFHGEQAPRIHISAERASAAPMWTITVRDNGIGIDPAFSDRVFIIFQRLHGREHYRGNGIGLSICKKIVERHGGRIWVESVPDQGATFRFTLPAVLAPAANGHLDDHPERHRQPPEP